MTIWFVLVVVVLMLSLIGWRWNQLEIDNLRRRSTRMVKGGVIDDVRFDEAQSFMASHRHGLSVRSVNNTCKPGFRAGF